MSGPVFVVGVRRSGTTLLCLMLDSHPRISMTYETGYIDAFYRRRETYGDLSAQENVAAVVHEFYATEGVRQWRKGALPSVATIAGAMREASMPALFDAIFSEVARSQGKQRWGDKSPDFIRTMEILGEMFPGAQFLHIIRDCRDIVLSRLGIRWFSHSVPRIASEWRDSIAQARRSGARLGPGRYLEVRYERLIREPESVLRGICDFLGEDYDDRMLRYHEDAANYLPGEEMNHHRNLEHAPIAAHRNLWKDALPVSTQKIVESVAGEMLLELGYECRGTDGHVWKAKRLYYKLHDCVDRALKRRF